MDFFTSEIIKELAEYGVIGLIILWLMYSQSKIQSKLFNVIENNTKALTKLTDNINFCRRNQDGN